MLTYCLKCKKKNTKNIDAKMLKNKNGRLNLSSKYAVCGSKKSRFMKEQEAELLLSNLSIKTPLNKIQLLGDKFMPEMHLRQPGFTYSTCGPFTKIYASRRYKLYSQE